MCFLDRFIVSLLMAVGGAFAHFVCWKTFHQIELLDPLFLWLFPLWVEYLLGSNTLSSDKRFSCCATEHPRMGDSALFVCSIFIVTLILWKFLPWHAFADIFGSAQPNSLHITGLRSLLQIFPLTLLQFLSLKNDRTLLRFFVLLCCLIKEVREYKTSYQMLGIALHHQKELLCYVDCENSNFTSDAKVIAKSDP